jgi:DNA-binding GntR family transcriptional regulator
MSTLHLTAGPVPRTSGLRREVTARLLDAFFSGEIRAGTRLRVQKLADRLGVSPSPVRESLVELAGIGMVDLIPNRGGVCRHFGPQQLLDLYHVRRILEVEATRCACSRLDRDLLQDLREQMTRLGTVPMKETGLRKAVELDQELHGAIAGCCGNERLAFEIWRYGEVMQSIRRVVGNRRESQVSALVEHVRIIDALLEQDVDQAARRMSEHIDATARRVTAVCFPESSLAIGSAKQ